MPIHHLKHASPLTTDDDFTSVNPVRAAALGRMDNHRARFDAFAVMVSAAVGTPICFYISLAIVVVWLAIGKPMQWNVTWQLIMNTISSIITFWMVFVLQTSQNRDTRSQQLHNVDLRNAIAEQQAQIRMLRSTVETLVGELAAIRSNLAHEPLS